MTYREQRGWIRALKCNDKHWGVLRGRCPIPPSLPPLAVSLRMNHTSHASWAIFSADPILWLFFHAAIQDPRVCWHCAGLQWAKHLRAKHWKVCILFVNLAPNHTVAWFPVCKMSILILLLSHCLSASTHKIVNSLRQGCLLGCVLGSTEPWNP